MALTFHRFIENDLSVFTEDHQMIMCSNDPVVSAYLNASNLQNWMTTLEKAIEEEPNIPQMLALREILFFFQYHHKKLKEQHESIIEKHQESITTDHPTSEDFQEYLMYYTRSISNQTL